MAEVNSTANQRTQDRLEAQQRERLQELRDKLKNDLEATSARSAKIHDQIENAYVVELSREKDDYESKLADIRANNAKRLEDEKIAGDNEVEKAKKAHQQHAAQVKENSEKTIAEMRRKYERAANEMQRRNEKIEKA